MRHILKIGLIAGPLLLALSACGGGGSGTVGSTTPPTTTTPAPTAFQDRFGTAFAANFNASTTAAPTDPAASDVPALNLTAEPSDN